MADDAYEFLGPDLMQPPPPAPHASHPNNPPPPPPSPFLVQQQKQQQQQQQQQQQTGSQLNSADGDSKAATPIKANRKKKKGKGSKSKSLENDKAIFEPVKLGGLWTMLITSIFSLIISICFVIIDLQ